MEYLEWTKRFLVNISLYNLYSINLQYVSCVWFSFFKIWLLYQGKKKLYGKLWLVEYEIEHNYYIYVFIWVWEKNTNFVWEIKWFGFIIWTIYFFLC